MKASLPLGVAVMAAILLASACAASSGSPGAVSSPSPPPAASSTLTASPTPAATPSPAATPAPVATPDRCGLVDRPTINAILGWGPSQAGGSGGGPGAPAFCTYIDFASGSSLTITFTQLPPGSAAAAVRAALATTGDFNLLTGIGDEAGDTVTANSAQVAFSKGQVIVVLAAGTKPGGGPALEPRLETLAKRIADKL